MTKTQTLIAAALIALTLVAVSTQNVTPVMPPRVQVSK